MEFSNKQLSVSYSGEIGEIFFNENAEIIIQGKMQQDGIFNEHTSINALPNMLIVWKTEKIIVEDNIEYSG